MAVPTPAVLKSPMQALLDMLKVNMSIHTTMHLDSHYIDHELYRLSLIPYLETNRLRPRLLAIQQTRPISAVVKANAAEAASTSSAAASAESSEQGNLARQEESPTWRRLLKVVPVECRARS
jgi:hypothetical protein